MISGDLIVTLVLFLLVAWAIFYFIPMPSKLRMVLGVIVAALLFIWLLSLIGIVAL